MNETDNFEAFIDSNTNAGLVNEEDRSHLISVICRLKRILSWDEDMEEQVYDMSRGPAIVNDFLTEFRIWKATMNAASAEEAGFRHLIVYSIAKLCFFYWIRDSALVGEVLQHVFECDGHFSPFFAYVAARDGRQSLFWRVTQNSEREKEHQALLFFLHHAHRSKTEFSGIRFIDVSLRNPMRVPPVILACLYGKPGPLLHFLRYGAILRRTPPPPSPTTRYADDWGVPLLLRHLMRMLWSSLGIELRNSEELDPDVVLTESTSNNIQCLNIMLRVIPQVALGELDFTLTSFDHGVLVEASNSRDFIRWVSTKNIVPKLAARYLEPSELTHLSRCVIRRFLNINWNLPFGIPLLQIPAMLRSYVNIGED